MRILLLTQYFPPENGAAQNRLSDLARRLCMAGHEVTVLTSMPNYPRGRIFEGYRGQIFSIETADGIRILRTWCYVSPTRGFVSRLSNYCSFAAMALVLGVLKGRKPDVIMVESPPLFLGITGRLLSRWNSAPMIFNVSDLWPESAVSMGVLRSKSLIRLAAALERHIYQHSYAITGQTEGIVEYIRECTNDVPVELVANGVDPECFQRIGEEREKYRAVFRFEGRFVVGFTGLHGLAYDFNGLLRAAEHVRNSYPPALFAFFGDGPAKAEAQAAARARRLSNVCFFPPQAATSMPGVLSALDAAIIPLKNSAFFRNTLPSRLFESMAAKLPVILAVSPGEATQLVQRANGGICVPPEDSGAIAGAVCELASDTARCRTLGENGNRYVCLHYDRREMAQRWIRLLPPMPGPQSRIADNPAAAVAQEQSAEV